MQHKPLIFIDVQSGDVGSLRDYIYNYYDIIILRILIAKYYKKCGDLHFGGEKCLLVINCYLSLNISEGLIE